MATYYKAKVGSLAGLEKHEIIHFGYMDTDSDEVIIKRKPWSKDVYKYDVHIAERAKRNSNIEIIKCELPRKLTL